VAPPSTRHPRALGRSLYEGGITGGKAPRHELWKEGYRQCNAVRQFRILAGGQPAIVTRAGTAGGDKRCAGMHWQSSERLARHQHAAILRGVGPGEIGGTDSLLLRNR
jgi:hypothetical protein